MWSISIFEAKYMIVHYRGKVKTQMQYFSGKGELCSMHKVSLVRV
jgi:hypothetical protein